MLRQSEPLIHVSPRTPCVEMGADIHLSVRRRPVKSDDVSKILNRICTHRFILSSWGESAGAISVALQMITNGGNNEGLFRGAVMQSGGPIPVGDIEHGQQYYDLMVEKTGCQSSQDTLECLRNVPYATFKKAMDESPNMFAYQVGAQLLCLFRSFINLKGLILAWLPRVDGVFLTEPPQVAVLRGHVSNVPMITGTLHCRKFVSSSIRLISFAGNCDDEGSLFSFSSSNVRQVSTVVVIV